MNLTVDRGGAIEVSEAAATATGMGMGTGMAMAGTGCQKSWSEFSVG